jgi:hypothetical protein
VQEVRPRRGRRRGGLVDHPDPHALSKQSARHCQAGRTGSHYQDICGLHIYTSSRYAINGASFTGGLERALAQHIGLG